MAAEASAAAETGEGAAGTADPLLTALLRLIRQLDRPCAEAELRAAAPIPEGGADAACLARVAERLGFAPRLEPVNRWRLRRLDRPTCCSAASLAKCGSCAGGRASTSSWSSRCRARRRPSRRGPRPGWARGPCA